MSKAPAFQFYAGDFLTGTTLMTNEEVGLYIRLLCLQAENGSVPDDPERLSQVYGASVPKLWKAVRSKFVAGTEPETMVNEKMGKVLADREEFRKRQSDKGKASAEARFTSGSKKKQPRFNRGSTGVEPLEGEEEDITSKRKERAKSKSIEDRKSEFITKCAAVVKADPTRLPDKLRAGFFEYWTEPTQDGKGMRFEAEKYFDHSRRMATWKANAEKRGELVKEGWNPRA